MDLVPDSVKVRVGEVAKSSLSLMILFIVFSISLKSQTPIKGYYTLSSGYDSNPLILNSAEESAIIRNSIGLGYFPEYSGFAFSYNSSLTSFLNFPERNYHTHRVKTDYVFQPFNYEYFEIYSGINAKLRSNGVDAELYNYYDINPEIGLIQYSDFGVISVDYSPQISRFSNYSVLDNFMNEINVNLDKTFDFETNLIARVSYGSKNYFNSDIDNNNSNGNGRNEKGKQYKRINQINPNHQSPNSVFTNQFNSLINFDLGLNHPINDNIILGVSFSTNFHLSDDGFYFESGTSDLYNNREFFDDIYNFEEQAITLFGSFKIDSNFRVKYHYQHYNRDFQYTLDLINKLYSDSIYRQDKGNSFNIEFNYRIFEKLDFFEKLSISLKLDYFANKSNLKEYTFETANIMLSTILEF